uniref:Uncharacterized protein n=1 Tax=Candidatus Kentrum sp. TC TaxID=2126339 RepID=A0A450YYJ4_9GAMM|nr:MAG: hypothetical protein BECKTC1821D_GA0114238_103328 [Candidatus Kentron sp. TC]
MKHRWHPRTGRQTRRVRALGQGIGTDRRTNDPHGSRSLPSLSLAGQDAGRLTGTLFGNGVSTGKVLRSGDRGTTRQRIPASRPRGNHWRGCSESDCGYGGEWDRFSFPWIKILSSLRQSIHHGGYIPRRIRYYSYCVGDPIRHGIFIIRHGMRVW